MPNDYLVFDKGYPKSVAVVPFQQLCRITSASITNTTKYKNIKLADPVAFQTIYQVDKDGKEIEGTKKHLKIVNRRILLLTSPRELG
jgi:hypothetical protein